MKKVFILIHIMLMNIKIKVYIIKIYLLGNILKRSEKIKKPFTINVLLGEYMQKILSLLHLLIDTI